MTPRSAPFAAAVLVLVACSANPAPASPVPTAWIDATAPLSPSTTPVFPGDAPMRFAFDKSLDRGDKLTLSSFALGAHSGTHVDAPLHFVAGGAPIDRVPLEAFVGPARVVDCSPDVTAIDARELALHDLRGATRVLFRTKNSRNGWMSDPAFHPDFAYLAPDAARILADEGVVLVGVDYISAERFGADRPETHLALLGKGIPIVEGLDLRAVAPGDYDLVVLPLRVVGHEAAPARAILAKRP